MQLQAKRSHTHVKDTADHVDYRSKITQKVKRMLFHQTKQDRMQIFKSHIFLSPVGFLQKEVFCKNSIDYRKISDLFVLMLFIALKKTISLKNCIQSYFVPLKSVLFNLLCFWGSFFRMLAVHSISEGFFFFMWSIETQKYPGRTTGWEV